MKRAFLVQLYRLGRWRLTRLTLYVMCGAGVCWGAFWIADYYAPLPDPMRVQSVLIEAQDHTPLRAFADPNGVWRYPVTLEEVSPLYVQALLEYEDRWFYQHLGVNPLALLRAVWQWLRHGRVISGGSTLTMQVARILEPHDKNVGGKLWQMFRALQLEWHYSKDEILTFYLNLAPFGGPIEGVQTASFAWLHKSAANLTHAEAALLAVLPQAPSRLRPDRHPDIAQRYRDKVLQRMAKRGIWTPMEVNDALIEPVAKAAFRQPMLAPLFAQRMKARAEAEQQARLTTVLDVNLQLAAEKVVRNRKGGLPEKTSIALMVVENQTGFVRAYVGSVDFQDDTHFGHVDMVQGLRSPGSTLKPFLYGMALDDGLIHSGSLLSDVPMQLDGYAPQNFYRQFTGAVSVTSALQQSLNVPAVDLLQRLTPARFVARLQNGGIAMVFPDRTAPNLSVILGGAGTRLEELVRGFTAFARDGVSIAPRFVATDPVVERRMLSAGAAWIVQTILRDIPPPNGFGNPQKIAWKTGTSYGFRDAWSVGVNDRYTIGVWTGRPDGTPLPGRYGMYAAAPILFDMFRALPKKREEHQGLARRKPANVTQHDICWPLGGLAETTPPEHCHVRQSAWLLDNTAPLTLPHLQQPSWSAGLETYWVNPATGLRVTAECSSAEREAKQFARWPVELNPWLSAAILDKMRLPDFDDSCPTDQRLQGANGLRIRQLDNSTQLFLPKFDINQPQTGKGVSIELRADGGQTPYTWLINGESVGKDQTAQGLRYAFTRAGDYVITVVDYLGAADKVSIRVISP